MKETEMHTKFKSFFEHGMTPIALLQRIEQRWRELQARDVSNHEFSCLMSSVSDYIHEYTEQG